jgi:hypothetical protein
MDLRHIEETRDIPLTLTTIQAFRDMLDVMEEFIRETEREQTETPADLSEGEK